MSLINKEDKIFIAGINGMVGSALRRICLSNGYENLVSPTKSQVNFLNYNEVSEWFLNTKPSIVIIAAAKVGGIYANKTYPADFLLENLKIQNNIIENSWKNNTKRLLFLGSSCIYPKNCKQPIKEESLLSGELESTNESYALAKIAGIKLCDSLRKQHGFDAISLMPTNLYGPRDNYHIENSHVLPALLSKFHEHKEENKKSITCWGSGKPRREFMHVDDLADACLFSLENWDPNESSAPKNNQGEPLTWLNVGTGIDITIKDLASQISMITEFKGEIKWDQTKPDGTYQKVLDIKQLKSLGWEPKIEFFEGLKLTYESYKKEKLQNKLRFF
tara:strand:+ start:4942 stop:5940 length:999 start_codon:yes stop_codon:yes gene_type:complete